MCRVGLPQHILPSCNGGVLFCNASLWGYDDMCKVLASNIVTHSITYQSHGFVCKCVFLLGGLRATQYKHVIEHVYTYILYIIYVCIHICYTYTRYTYYTLYIHNIHIFYISFYLSITLFILVLILSTTDCIWHIVQTTCSCIVLVVTSRCEWGANACPHGRLSLSLANGGPMLTH